VNEALLLYAHLACTLVMVGLIWFVQVVHYPLMAGVGRERFREYERLHQSRTTWVVAGPMLLEAITAAALVWLRPGLLLSPEFAIAAILLAIIWISTAWLQVPLHERLAEGFDASLIERLVRSNWIRTWGWSARAVLLGAVLLSGEATYLNH
jgi:hypothetical protein